jgi:hypothetical protein
MRTTLTLDDDVAVELKKLQRERNVGLKEAVNAALRAGLQRLQQPSTPRPPYRLQPISVGRLLIADLDNVAEVLALVEGESYK